MPLAGIPDFFIVGAPRCGTTALYEYLKTHPKIYMPSYEKEPHFFATDLFSDSERRYKDLADYLRLFRSAQPGQQTGEASVFYLSSSVAIPGILKVNPAAKFIALVRNPIDMVCSLHNHLVNFLEEDIWDVEVAWRAQEERRSGGRLSRRCTESRLLQYKAICSLGTQLQRLFALVEKPHRHVIVFDDLLRDARSVYIKVLEFLGVCDDGRTVFNRFNERRALRSVTFARVLVGARNMCGPGYVPLKRGLNALRLRPKWLWDLNLKPAPRSSLNPDFRRELQQVFWNEIKILEELLGRSLQNWLNSHGTR